MDWLNYPIRSGKHPLTYLDIRIPSLFHWIDQCYLFLFFIIFQFIFQDSDGNKVWGRLDDLNILAPYFTLFSTLRSISSFFYSFWGIIYSRRFIPTMKHFQIVDGFVYFKVSILIDLWSSKLLKWYLSWFLLLLALFYTQIFGFSVILLRLLNNHLLFFHYS